MYTYYINIHVIMVMSVFLFMTSCQFSWMFNGMRQFLVAAIMFACTDLILKKKPIPIYNNSFNYCRQFINLH